MDTRGIEDGSVTPTSIRVDCVTRTDRVSVHHRIRAIGGPGRGGNRWRLSEEAAITAMQHDRAAFHIVLPGGRRIDLVIGLGLGKTYLKTEADGESPDMLLQLPDCG